ncbi:DUF1848 family protein, partial [Candidatus Hydrogenedentota bacterium]
DPIMLTSATPPEWHLENFERLARELRGSTARCIFSFPTLYKKTIRNLNFLPNSQSIRVWSKGNGDFSESDLEKLAWELAAIARENDMQMQTCCNDKWINPLAGITKASCADWPLLKSMLNTDIREEIAKNPTRKNCGCYKSIDVGRYQTCAHGCVYCYATDSLERGQTHHNAHDSEAGML